MTPICDYAPIGNCETALIVFHALPDHEKFKRTVGPAIGSKAMIAGFHPFDGPNILFFAAWPMLGACFALYYLRQFDCFLTLPRRQTSGANI